MWSYASFDELSEEDVDTVDARLPAASRTWRAASGRVVNPSAIWHSTRMQRREIIETLRAHRAELCAAGIVHLRLHGSVARGEASSNSDVDLIAEFEPARRLTLIDMVRLENRLRDVLGVKVDLSPANTLKEPVRRRAEREAVLAF